jgi:hypothetical protein
MKLSDVVFPDINAARSIHIERDLGQTSTLKDYQVTQKALEVIKRFVDALKGERVSAWSITGPYGMGKSAFANFLIALVGEKSDPDAKLARSKLRQSDNNVLNDLQEALSRVSNSRGFFQVPITAAYEPINKSLISGLLKSISYRIKTDGGNRKIKSLLTSLNRLTKQEAPETSEVYNKFKESHTIFNVPIVLVIDEFGKNLEYMAHHPDRGDIYVIQMLAESNYAYVWVCLHQAFEEYASGLTLQQRQEWGKVQGRFEDISFVESTAQMLELTRRVLNQKKGKNFSEALERWATKLEKELIKLSFPINHEMSASKIATLYPLHPVASIALPELCRRFAQNDRTLFSFLCSGDPYALPSFLKTNEIQNNKEALPALGLDHLYDYFFSSFTTAFIDRAESQKWIEIQDIIRQARSYSDIGQKILKSVGVLNLIAGSSGLKATRELLKFALGATLGLEAKEVELEIDALVGRKVLIFREYAHEYRLWEGSDFDIVAAIREKKAIIATKLLEQVLQTYFPLRPLIASRYSYETGTVRRFERRWMSLSDLEKSAPSPNKGFDGLLLYCFGTKKRVTTLPEQCSDKRPLVVAYASNQNQIKEIALEVAAVKAVLKESPELVHDGVARREARFRVRAAEDQLRGYVEQIYSANSADLRWYTENGEIKIYSYREVSSLLSDLCEKAYSKCPRIGNEMINYDRLSTAAARARRELAEAMATRSGEKNLGLKGYGPEVALYKSLFLATNLHKKQNNGRWRFISPREDNKDLYPLWALLSARVKDAGSEGIRVDLLMDELKEPSFGMREGPIPLYISFFLIVNSDEISLFQEGTYKPYFDEADIALMIKRPELFSLKRFTLEGINRDLFETYLMVLNTMNLEDDQSIRNPSLLSVIAPLVRFFDNLPPYTRFTRSISKNAQRVRTAVLNAYDPLKLLFEELPLAVGIEPTNIKQEENANYWKKELQIRLRDALLDTANAYKELNRLVQKLLMEAFKFNGPLSEFYIDLRKRSQRLIPACGDQELKSILTMIVSESSDLEGWIRGIAGLIMESPLDSWSDADIDQFAVAIRDYAKRLEHLEELTSAGLDNIAIDDKEARVVSIMTNTGRLGRRILRAKPSDLKKAKEMLEGIKDWTDQEREAVYILLGDEIMSQDRDESR